MKHYKTLAGFAVMLLLTSTLAFGHSGATGIVKERMDGMKSIARSMKILAPMVRGETAIEEKIFADAALRIANHSSEMPALFPEGSTQHPTEAAPAIWQDKEAFDALFADMTLAASELAKYAKNTKTSSTIQAGFQKLGETCKACHAEFRIKK